MNGIDRHVDLYVRSSKDGNSLGACPFCQEMYMMVWLKADGGALTYDLHIIDPTRPPSDFRKFANRLPVLKHSGDVIVDNEEMVAYLDDHFPEVNLTFDDAVANANCLDVFSKFSFYIHDVSTSNTQLRQELWRINDHYEKSGHRYLCGDDLTSLDLLMIPKLHHIRVAAFALKDFVIPKSMTGIWTYLGHAYRSEVFRKTCPSDQEIVQHWTSKPDTAKLSGECAAFYSIDTEPRYTWTTPIDDDGGYEELKHDDDNDDDLRDYEQLRKMSTDGGAE